MHNVLITNTVAGALLKRTKKDKQRDMYYNTYDNKYQTYQTCYHTYINEVEKKDSKNIILINIKKHNIPVNHFYQKKDNKKKIHFNKKSRMMHQHRPSKKHCKN